MKRVLSLIFPLLLILTLSGCSNRDNFSELHSHLDELEAEGKFSGVVLIAKDGELIFERASGLADRNHAVPNQMNTKFNLGSMNKMFTAIAVMQLVAEGVLSVEDNLIDHLPDYPNQAVAEAVTIHQLLTHTSGMGDIFTQDFRNTSKDRYKRLEDYLPLFVDQPLIFEPGARGSYSNAGFLVLGLIIEEASGQTYFDYIEENIYQPCGMTDSGSYELDRVVPNIAVGYAGNLRNYGDVSSNLYILPFRGSSAGGGYSTAYDLLRFSQCLINHQLLSPASTDLLLEGRVENLLPGIDGKYAYGFWVNIVEGRRIVGHGGAYPGVCTLLNIDLDLGYSIVVLSNTTNDCLRVIPEANKVLAH